MTFVLRDGVAVLTGAASGIGKATALLLAAHGCHLALADRNADGLATVAASARARGVRVSEHVLDVADYEEIMELPEKVMSEHGKVTILMNNAGVGLVGTFDELSLDEFRWLIEINLMAVVNLTNVFLPILRQQPQAHIVNISSIFGIIAPPEQTAYVAAKFAVRGFSESLRHELEGSNVSLTVVHPGGIQTNIANSARVAAKADPALAKASLTEFNKTLRTSPEEAAEQIVGAIQRRAPRLLIGNDAKGMELLQRLMPVRYWKLMQKVYAKVLEAGKK